MSHLVIVLGAGCSRSQVAHPPDPNCRSESIPPLDSEFFSKMPPSISNSFEFKQVRRYLKNHYRYHLGSNGLDSFESVASIVYTDTFATRTQDSAYPVLLDLIQILSRRIALSTNSLIADDQNILQHVFQKHFNEIPSQTITIVTFNYDIQAERALDFAASRFPSASQTMVFPGCYRLQEHSIHGVRNHPRFVRKARLDQSHDGIPILKLHGSLNWYTPYNSRTPSKQRFLSSSKRDFRIGNTNTLPEWPLLTKSASPRRHFGYPVLVPPVPHKSALFHDDIKALWSLAADQLSTADELLIFGYSCPSTDQEAANLFRSAAARNERLRHITVIDPNPAIAERFIELTRAASCSWFRSVHDYLE